ncbi:hypothetical protein [Vibrio crassostreae]|uniref:hypothetical protein n=1 Tax=Vibrio crassostreae TaxID=246167 RepID=UPI001B30465E|nr:hypothetical protein [Vibrio crassostreae]
MSDTYRNTIAYTEKKDPEVAMNDKTAKKYANKEKIADHKRKRNGEKLAIQTAIRSDDEESVLMPNTK